jgi:uncharacterized protein
LSVRPIHEGLFELGDDGSIALIGGYSPASAKFHFPLLDTCPYSGARDVQRITLSRDATLWAWTAVTAAPPGYTGRVPYGFGVVELVHEQLRVITRLRESDPERLAYGQRLTLVAEDLPDGVVTWAFA